MESIVDAVLDALTREYGRHDTPGWMYAISFIIIGYTWYTGKEILKKKKILRLKKENELANKELFASLVTEVDGNKIEYSAKIINLNNRFQLIVEKLDDGVKTKVTEISKNTIDDIAEYLRSKTKFVLSDFK